MKHTLPLILFAFTLPALGQDAKHRHHLRSEYFAGATPLHAHPSRLVRARQHRRRRPDRRAGQLDGRQGRIIPSANWRFILSSGIAGTWPGSRGRPLEKFNGRNDETFTSFDSKQWSATVKQLDEVMTEWEKAVEAADEAKLKSWYSTIAHIGAHNAYHIGQIIYVRKEQGCWYPKKV